MAQFLTTSSGPIKFQLASDVHLEFADGTAPNQYNTFTISRNAPYLILAGDIGLLLHEDEFRSFLARHTAVFAHVFLVLGNHEFYQTSRPAGLGAAYRIESALAPKLTVLNRKRVDVSPEVTLLGCTLHSQVKSDQASYIRLCLNDFRSTTNWTLEDYAEEHDKDLEWMKEELKKVAKEEPQRRVIIATHHAPTYVESSDPMHKESPLNSAFCTAVLENEGTLDGKEVLKTWCFGHTHFCTDYMTPGGIRVVANQKGYPHEKGMNYDEKKVLEI